MQLQISVNFFYQNLFFYLTLKKRRHVNQENSTGSYCLETQLLEEPLVLALLVHRLELDAGLETVRLALNGILQILGRQLLEANVVRCVAGRHQMIVVQALQERLDLGLLLQLVLAHLLGHLAGVSVDAGNERMTEGFLRGTIVRGLDDDGLATSVTSTKDDYDLALFHNFPHFGG